MKVTRKLAVPVSVVEDIFCNKCGLSCKSPAGDYYGLIEATVTAGFYSTHFEDGDVHKISICERCLRDMILSFKYPSFQGNYMELSDDHVEDFDPHDYWPAGTKLSIDSDTDETSVEMEVVHGNMEEDYYSIDDEIRSDEADDIINSYPRPSRIKKEDLN